ncbi:MAG: MATE family efflux transporter [Rhodospirillales bacterium]|nr:MATE family efflux transporter [Rhodospirillales bacterium]
MTIAPARALPLRPPARTLSEHVTRTFSLALPVMFGRAGLLIMFTVALVMVGHAGPNDQAYFAAGFAPHMLVLVFGMGLVASVTVLSAQADGAGNAAQCGRIWRLGLLLAAACGGGGAVAMLWGEDILRLAGQDEDIALHGGAVILMFAPGMPAALMFVATSAFLESIGRPRPGMIVSLAANVVNLVLCWIFVFGKFGLPAMGAPGAALAITVTRWCMVAAIICYTLALPEREHYGVRAALAGHYRTIGKLLRVGTPLALAMGIESVAFTLTTMFAGWLGNDALAAYQDAININAFVFMLALGLQTATSVRVANAVGRNDQTGLRLAGWVGAGLNIGLLAAVGVVIWFSRDAIATVFTSNPAVHAPLVAALGLVAVISICDGLQAVLIGATRGVADTVVPTVLQGISFWVIMVPLTYYLSIAAGMGVNGLFLGIGISVLAASLFLAIRFAMLTQRHIRPV